MNTHLALQMCELWPILCKFEGNWESKQLGIQALTNRRLYRLAKARKAAIKAGRPVPDTGRSPRGGGSHGGGGGTHRWRLG
jgi:uncharacterized membrane protein YgcG